MEKMTRKTLRLPDTLLEGIDRSIPEYFSSLSELIRVAIENFTKEYDFEALRKKSLSKKKY